MMRKPTLVAVSGPPGAGKTTLARALAEALGWPLVCRDEIKEHLVGSPSDPGQGLASQPARPARPADELNLTTLQMFFDALGRYLKSGTSVVAEAAFQDRLWRPGLKPLMALASLRVIRCVVEPELARLRIARRVADVPSRWAHADEDLLSRIAQGQRPIESWVPISLDVPTLLVDTTDGWTPPLDRITAFAEHHGSR